MIVQSNKAKKKKKGGGLFHFTGVVQKLACLDQFAAFYVVMCHREINVTINFGGDSHD